MEWFVNSFQLLELVEMQKVTLILGGARSGKSAHGEMLALERFSSPVYIFTAQAWDDEMKDRVKIHKQRRNGKNWKDVEAPLELSEAIKNNATINNCILIDCLTLWLTNLLLAGVDIDKAIDELLATIEACPGEVILISSEVGLGIVPENSMARKFRDLSGKLHQKLAIEAENVLLMVAGIPMVVKENS